MGAFGHGIMDNDEALDLCGWVDDMGCGSYILENIDAEALALKGQELLDVLTDRNTSDHEWLAFGQIFVEAGVPFPGVLRQVLFHAIGREMKMSFTWRDPAERERELTEFREVVERHGKDMD
jgi:hypothetical protein